MSFASQLIVPGPVHLGSFCNYGPQHSQSPLILFLLPLSWAHPRTAAVLVDELDRTMPCPPQAVLSIKLGLLWPVKCRIHQLLETGTEAPLHGRPFIRAHRTFCISAAFCALWSTSAGCQEAAKQPKLNREVERCRRINNEHMRTHCLEEINAKANPVPQQQPPVPGTWQLARIPNRSGGPDTISITKITNSTPSEQDVTGLMLRCAEGATTNVLIVLAAPLPLRAHPKVIVAAGATTEFIASVVPPGALVLLPEKASALIENAWQSVPELAVSITDNNRAVRGVIPLEGISSAMQELQSNCPKVGRGRE